MVSILIESPLSQLNLTYFHLTYYINNVIIKKTHVHRDTRL